MWYGGQTNRLTESVAAGVQRTEGVEQYKRGVYQPALHLRAARRGFDAGSGGKREERCSVEDAKGERDAPGVSPLSGCSDSEIQSSPAGIAGSHPTLSKTSALSPVVLHIRSAQISRYKSDRNCVVWRKN